MSDKTYIVRVSSFKIMYIRERERDLVKYRIKLVHYQVTTFIAALYSRTIEHMILGRTIDTGLSPS